MENRKYAANFIYEPKPDANPRMERPDAPPADITSRLMYIDDDYVKGAFYTEVDWLMKGYPDKVWVRAHTHDFDEYITFWGSDPYNKTDLGGEVEIWLEDEKYTITRSCLIFVPKGMKHCPLIIKRVDRPIFHFSSGPSNMYRDGNET